MSLKLRMCSFYIAYVLANEQRSIRSGGAVVFSFISAPCGPDYT